VPTSRPFRGVTVVLVAVLLVGCSSVNPPPSPTGTPTAALPTSTASPSPAASPATFPLAIVTGLTNLKSVIDLDELATLAKNGKLALPCGVEVVEPKLTSSKPCVWADEIAAAIESNQKLVALLPPGLVEPATKVLPIAGDGPFGLFGADLFGDPKSRAMEYPVIGSAEDPYALEPAWTAYDASQIWTMTAVGSLCADRSGAKQAVTLGKGWDWIFEGGTARYNGKPFLDPTPAPGISAHVIVAPVSTGNAGTLASIVKRSDVALGNQKCPILPTKDWAPATGSSVNLSVPEDVLPRWRDFLGLDAVYLPADHQGDKGITGIRSTLRLIDKYDVPRTGLGMNLDEALEPAYVEVAGLKLAFVSWNEVPGPPHADADSPGVAWLTKANVDAAVRRAKAGGADLIFCDPQWWGGSEYHPDLWGTQKKALGWMDKAGCDQVLGGGLHVTGGLFFRQHANGVSIVDAGPGNFLFGQDWWQETQEGVILDMTFHGKTLVNVRLHPYVMILAARPSLLDPEVDGHYVLQRIWKNSDIDYPLNAGGA
jgi:hypothetical protein